MVCSAAVRAPWAASLVRGRAQASGGHRWAVAAAARKQQQQRQQQQQQQAPGSKGFGGKATPEQPVAEDADVQQQQAAAPPSPAATEPAAPPAAPAAGSAAGPAAALPAVGRGRIFAVCAQVSLLVTTLGVVLRQVAPAISPAVKDGQGEAVEALLNWAAVPGAGDLALAAAVAGGVTAARAALLAAWPEFKAASDRSNQQVLGPLGPADLLWVGALPAVSEELLFRGALIPAIYPDWRGVLIAGLAFGVLHNSGGRNPAFAAWASLVGAAYGALFLATGAVACPALAHTLANIASGALWRAANSGGGDSK